MMARLRYLVTGGRSKLRKYYHSPFYLRLQAIYQQTAVGKASMAVRDRSH